MSVEIESIPSPNCSSRNGTSVSAVVLHYTDSMNIEGTIAWFQDPQSQVSAHYVIGRDGRVVRMVDECYKAWHAGPAKLFGRVGVNSFSIGIELVGTDGSGFAEPQMLVLIELLQDICSRYGIEQRFVVGHRDVLPGQKIDPDGTHQQFDWARVRSALV